MTFVENLCFKIINTKYLAVVEWFDLLVLLSALNVIHFILSASDKIIPSETSTDSSIYFTWTPQLALQRQFRLLTITFISMKLRQNCFQHLLMNDSNDINSVFNFVHWINCKIREGAAQANPMHNWIVQISFWLQRHFNPIFNSFIDKRYIWIKMIWFSSLSENKKGKCYFHHQFSILKEIQVSNVYVNIMIYENSRSIIWVDFISIDEYCECIEYKRKNEFEVVLLKRFD